MITMILETFVLLVSQSIETSGDEIKVQFMKPHNNGFLNLFIDSKIGLARYFFNGPKKGKLLDVRYRMWEDAPIHSIGNTVSNYTQPSPCIVKLRHAIIGLHLRAVPIVSADCLVLHTSIIDSVSASVAIYCSI
ncbi:hypothetical protein HNY73_006805 [Argiope bruennichi]|uniref:Uncharacterized protein n=1 Tax=Argiope bruennichi TaxID=94029 RepID=A0A8T0FH49_ARGBR|nr:hypothetical protein HNY73_006805 [Argiope bruennichi]